MAVLLIVVVVAVLVLLYAADRLRQARSRARLRHEMNDRLTVAAAQIDQEQERRRVAAMASAELTSVLPAIMRPPLTLPGMPGHEAEPAQDEPAGGRPAAAGLPADAPARSPDQSADQPGAAAEPSAEPSADQPADAALEPAGSDGSGGAPAGDSGRAESTLTMPGTGEPAAAPAPRMRLTAEGTLIMSPVSVPDNSAAPAPRRPASRRQPGEPGDS